MGLKVGDKVRVVDTSMTFNIEPNTVGTVALVSEGTVCVKFPNRVGGQYVRPNHVQPVSEVIKINCHKPNVLQRICNYLRGIK